MDATSALMIANLLFFALYVTAILLTRRSYGALKGSRWFALSNGLRGVVMLVFLTKPTVPEPWLSPVVNALAILGFLALHRAFAELLEIPRRLWRTQVALTATGLAVMIAASGAGHYALFLTAMSLTMAGVLEVMAWMLITTRRPGGRGGAEWFTGTLLAAYAAISVWRAIDALQGHAEWGTANLGWHTVMWLLASLVVNGGTAFGFVHIASLELARQLDLRAQTDALTGLLNRHGLEMVMAAIAGDEGITEVSVVAIDLDKFKAANDRWGHEFGDAILKATGSRLKGCLRASDFGLRMGGDEFLVVLPGADEAEAAQIAERVRAEIGLVSGVPGGGTMGGSTVGVQASFGLATMAVDGLEWGQLLRSADEAMYRAKREGRNRVFVADSGRVRASA